ncbi:Chitinase domain-containing protein 1 [Toxocara canis]|uniref:Chitinase domain-containing protein 1 n=1 Tax=Toxocara canis TaxID=6265 RepID=A0A0B2VXJ4_TOXCA|nr:Chitinase domain-containing protein 1 [Toxocara canis]
MRLLIMGTHTAWFCAIIMLSMAVTSCYGTLSKSDRKPKNSKAKIAKTAERSAPAVVSAHVNAEKSELEVDPNEVTVSSILVEHAQLDIGEKKFNRPTLGYVTPWNSHGYNIAKWAAKKFTHISPVWFQLKPANIDGQKTCSIGGTHDIDQRWMADVRSNNSDVSFVPRFLMEDWTSGTVDDFLYDEIWQRRCAQAMVDLIERNEMQGVVMEMWLQLMSLTRGRMNKLLIELVASWSDYFHAKDLEFILPISPPLNEIYEYTSIISAENFAEVAKHVDYINIMLYDYHIDRAAGVAPIGWIQRNMEFLLRESPVSASKVLMGLNFYGFEFTPTKMNAITFSKYLEHLKSDDVLLNWDGTASEHFIISGTTICYYPSLASLSVRLRYAERMNMGVSIWELGQGLPYFTRLL